MKVILLDLNHTLVGNSEIKKSPFEKQIEQEVYRMDLIEKIKDHLIILITARPDKYRHKTLSNILEKTGWTPNDYYFNYQFLPPQVFKENILLEYLFTKYKKKDLIAIESNPITRRMYKKHGIPSFTYKEYMELQNE